MITILKHQAQLEALRLTTLEDVRRYQGELVKDHHGRRDIQHIQLPDGTRLFLKRIWQAHRKDGLRSLFTRGAVWSICREEFDNCQTLATAGIAVAAPVAYGEDCGPLWEKFSFIITEAATGRPLDELLRECRDPAERRLMFDALAQFVRQLHDAGYSTPDLFTRHIFVTGTRFCLIDMARLDRTAHRSRDLAALHLTAPLRFVTEAERKRFLEIYGAPELCAPIQQRAQHLAKRRKFQDFFKKSEPNVN